MDRYSFFGKGSILIKALSPGSYGDTVREANEPIAYFTEVLISISFSNVEKVAKTGVENLLGDSKAAPALLRVQGIKTNESLQSLLYKKQSNTSKVRTIIKDVVATGGTVYLPISEGQTLLPEIFIYKKLTKEKDVGYSVDLNTGIITGLSNETHTVFYKLDSNAYATYQLENPNIPNLSVEVFIDGNLNEKTGSAVLHLDKVKLLSKPSLDFTSKDPFIDSLEFAILSDKSAAEVNYYG